MDYIRRLPLLMALASGIITGLVGYANQVQNNENMINMLIAMVIFYIAGLMIRGTVIDVIETNRIKEEEKKQEEKLKAKKREKNEKMRKQNIENGSGSTLDLAADDDLNLGINDEEFDTLPIADYIRNELKK
ncbi:MAG TPA: hypothetical protein GXZ22_01185 [Clostridiaceae bacterium]|jgi:hypothetical protein|nr:hypothetical protein [Clostridiaceae bacterium]